jgi:protein ImuB
MQRGVKIGLPMNVARALAPEAEILSANPEHEQDRLRILARWLLKFSPLVGLDRERAILPTGSNIASHNDHPLHDGIILDITGTERLHGDPGELAQKLFGIFSRWQLQCRIAVTPSIGGGWALSRFDRTRQAIRIALKTETLLTFMEELPIEALRISPSIAEKLHKVGISSIRELLLLPRRTLGNRFGKELLLRFAQAAGDVEEHLFTIQTEHSFTVRRSFEQPISSRQLLAKLTRTLFKELCLQLLLHHKCSTLFVLKIGSQAGTEIEKQFPLTEPSASDQHLATIIDPLLESVPLYEEVFRLQLDARDVHPMTLDQRTFEQHVHQSPTDRQIGEALNTFSLRLGKARVVQSYLVESHIPEKGFSRGPFNLFKPDLSKKTDTLHTFSSLERPPELYESPLPIKTIAMLPDRPPSAIVLRTKHLRIITGVGPERISGEWWSDSSPGDRDYFRVQDEKGRWLWIYRENTTMSWFLHGAWN